MQIIRSHPSALEIYQKKLLESGHASQEDIDRIQNKVDTILNQELLASKDYLPKRRDWLSSHWTGFKSPEQLSRVRNTGYVSYSELFSWLYDWISFNLILQYTQGKPRDFEECR